MARTYSNAFECYEAIGSWLANAVPEAWKQITIEFEIIVIDDVSEECIYYKPKRWWRKEGQFFIEDTNFTDIFFQFDVPPL